MINSRLPIGEGSDSRERGGHKIEWTDTTWNPVRGCSRISEGCRYCYAERQAARNLPGMKSPTSGEPFAVIKNGERHWTGKVELIESKLLEPLHWKKPRLVFVNSMSDLFHENLPYPDILHIFQVMAKCQRHTFQILTKRQAKMRKLLSLLWWRNLGYSPDLGGDYWVKVIAGEQRTGDQNFLPNVWLGVSVENQATADERIPELLETPTAIRFVSYEPALAEVDFGLNQWIRLFRLIKSDIPVPVKERLIASAAVYRAESNPHGALSVRVPGGLLGVKPDEFERLPTIDWGIIGGESGPKARPFNLKWARNTIQQFKAAQVPLFVKQVGSRPVSDDKADLPYLVDLKGKGGDPDDWPEDLRVRQFPTVA